MGWVEALRGKVVCMDTTPLIFYMEDRPIYADMLEPVFQAATRGEVAIKTSMITWLEVLVLPVRNGDGELAKKYRNMLFHTEGLTTLSISREIIEQAARLRAFHQNLRTPDAIQVATAIHVGAPFFLTNDVRLSSISELSVLVLDKLRTEPAS